MAATTPPCEAWGTSRAWLVAKGGIWMAPKGRERPISRYLLTYCQRPSNSYTKSANTRGFN